MSTVTELENLGDQKVFYFEHQNTDDYDSDVRHARLYNDYYDDILIPQRENIQRNKRSTRTVRGVKKSALSYGEVKEFIRYLRGLFQQGEAYFADFPFIFSTPGPQFKEDFEIPYKIILLTYSMVRGSNGVYIKETVEVCETFNNVFR